MIVVHKYELSTHKNPNILELPHSAVPLKFDSQGNKYCLWVQIDTDNSLETREFVVFCTGEEISYKSFKYIDTLVERTLHSTFVWHLYEVNYD